VSSLRLVFFQFFLSIHVRSCSKEWLYVPILVSSCRSPRSFLWFDHQKKKLVAPGGSTSYVILALLSSDDIPLLDSSGTLKQVAAPVSRLP
jgi:hypothetical protein